MWKHIKNPIFFLPLSVSVLLGVGLVVHDFLIAGAILLGLLKIAFDSVIHIKNRKYSLDYIAFLAMLISLLSSEYVAGAIIALMFTGGEALEAFASERAHMALKKLSDTIPKVCFVKNKSTFDSVPIQEVAENSVILIKQHEVVPLDGILVSPQSSLLNIANLTGEIEPVAVQANTFIKSGSINIGESIQLSVVGNFSTSTYRKIVTLVEDAQAHPSKTVRLSEHANYYFTILTLCIAGATYLLSQDMTRFLAVLVIATPCPLIIAAPVAFVSGMSKAARNGILIRKPSAFEGIVKATRIFFDKTGTLTLGEPLLSMIHILKKTTHIKTENDALSVAAGLEVHSLHPLAKAIVSRAQEKHLHLIVANSVEEKIGTGISGKMYDTLFSIAAAKRHGSGLLLSLFEKSQEVAIFQFQDVLKEGSKQFLSRLQQRGVITNIITGDKKENAEKIFAGLPLRIYADQSPEDKYQIIASQTANHTVVMVGDGINDAPALAKAHVGIVFSGTENGASIEACDVAILGSGIDKLDRLFSISHNTVSIAMQSIYGGIILSTIGMIFAAFGFIPPVVGALIQEAIDVLVILNALRALR